MDLKFFPAARLKKRKRERKIGFKFSEVPNTWDTPEKPGCTAALASPNSIVGAA
jgi:hypothetical protein